MCGIVVGLLIIIGVIARFFTNVGPTAGWIALVIGVVIFTPVGGLVLSRTAGWQGHQDDDR